LDYLVKEFGLFDDPGHCRRHLFGLNAASIAFLTASFLTSSALSQPAGKPPGPWRHSVEAGAGHQFDTDGDDGGSLSVTRTFVQPSIGYGWDRQTSVGLSFGFSYDDYDFDGSDGLIGLDPWDKVLGYSLGLPIRFGISPDIGALVVPSIRWNAETGANLDDAVSAGGVAGFTYRMSDRLRIGPGVTVSSGIEESFTIIPIVLLDWDISDEVSLSTGGGSGSGGGAGITLSWKTSDELRLGLGANYQSRRFRLDDEGVAPDGVGEDEAASITASASYSPLPFVRASLEGGLTFAGNLRLEDEDGDRIVDEDVDPAPFIGFSLNARW
jgi:hypothetical protein